MTKNKRVILTAATLLVIALLAICCYIAHYWNLIPYKSYTAEDFGIEIVKSPVDFNSNGVDDFTDILEGAKLDAEKKPEYNGRYYEGGYPPDNIGVCTDVIWRAFKQAGYNLRAMLDNDIKENPNRYPNIEKPDSNIDFRRVRNLRRFFEKYSVSLTTDPEDISQWQPGDIVVYKNEKHIAIVSDKRNNKGTAYIIHNAGQPVRDEDALTRQTISAHYRFDASLIDDDILIKWDE